MCGIAGYVGRDTARLRAADQSMLDAIAYRGPDARTQWGDGALATLHHARLSIIDLECGGQPMSDATGRYTIVFNGAIYNYQELRREYEQAGAVFTTQSDTEVLLNGFALKGERVLRDLNGMFAFAIWDSTTRELFMARDRLGKKPLFWTMNGGALLFGSTAAAFRRIPGWSDELSRAGLVLYSFLGGFPGTTTAFARVHAIPAAHFGWFAPGDASPRLTRYWILDYRTKREGSEGAQLDEYNALLEDAVRLRLRSDVPVALSFSGGVDSGSIGSVAKRIGATLNCYTIDYDTLDEPSPEVAMARRVATLLQLPWQHIQYEYRGELLEGLSTAYRDFDQPCQQLGLVYSRRLYEVMSRHCRVVLSGNGADELFTGYAGDESQWQFDRQRRWLRRIPDGFYQRLPSGRRAEWDHVRLNRLTMAEWARADMLAYAREYTRDDAVIDECRAAIDRLCDEFASAGADTQMDFVMHRALVVSTQDTNYRLPDITGYAAHVEVRSPFLDHRMVEFAARLPHRFKVSRFHGRLRAKYLPRLAYQRLTNEEIAWAPKLGMGGNLNWHLEFAHNPKFRAVLAQAFEALPDAGIDPSRFQRAYAHFVEDVAAGATAFPTASTMMTGFMLGVWLQRVIGDRRAASSRTAAS